MVSNIRRKEMLPGDFNYTIQRHFGLAKQAFEAWFLEGGTLEKARYILADRGIKNHRTNRPYTKMGIQQAAWRYIVENHETVKPILLGIWGDHGYKNVPEEVWDRYVVNIAIKILGNSSRGRFMRWLEENPQFKKYEDMYAVRFGIEADKYIDE